MAEIKTKKSGASVGKFIESIADPKQREDCSQILRIMQSVTKEDPVMWGDSMIGFGNYHYKYASGHEGDCFLTGFSPRKGKLTLYIMSGFTRFEGLLKKLGTCKTGKSCLYLKSLDDVDPATLKTLVEESVAHMKKTYSSS